MSGNGAYLALAILLAWNLLVSTPAADAKQSVPGRPTTWEAHTSWKLWLPFLPVSQLLSAQSSSVPYDTDFGGGPTFDVVSASYSYPSSYRSIREVEFKNLTLNVLEEKAKPERYRLKNGRCETDDHPGHTSVELGGIHYLSPGEAGREYAMALYSMNSVGGSSSQEGIAQVFELSSKRLRVTQQISWDLHFGGPWAPFDSYDEKTTTFVIRTAHYLPGDAHCCVSAVDIVTLRWNRSRFVQVDMRTELSDYGKHEGKKLQC